MAISLLGNNGYGPTEGNPISGSYTCHAAVIGSRKLIVWVAGEVAGGADVNSVTYNGVSLTKYQEDDSGINPMAMFFLDDDNFPTTPGSYTLEATFSTSMSPGFMMVIELDGAAQGPPSAYEFQALTSTSTNNDTITTTLDGSWLCSFVCTGGPGTFTATSGQTLLNQASGGGGGAAAGHGYEAIATAGAESTNWSFDSTANRFGQSSCCIEPAALNNNAAIIGAQF